ncbi:hypothetical protein KSC_051370 [Ktedonobacter sp. SOSP1-52]|uniref:hypothetical protein n=1 Tax=Ktedonobacter sp. SOSP1-52 TaxID=2778366 RepID=UPI0019167F01|nr:hypothetical protein [Ktedonobacter sp. SOSP1-52]GHO66245.1 hypothetical protein KSC_051370 [Ktedonobacter sp. SOSP1-52]
MPESKEQIQQEAYVQGQQMKQWHDQQQRVLTQEALAILAADFAQISLFKSNQQVSGAATHERAGVCIRAFLEGYGSGLA